MHSRQQLLTEYEYVKSSVQSSDFHDAGFLETYQSRFLYFLDQMQRILPVDAGRDLLELGSYHLHLSTLLSRMGYQVRGVDLPIFAERPVVAARALEFGIDNRSYALSQTGKPVIIPYPDASVDAVVCTEMLEHLTFNPVRFWSEVYRIMRNDAVLVLTTPNSLSLVNSLAHLKRLLMRESVGLESKAILGSITSGHHWKEYSLQEIIRYFSALSPDFDFKVAEYYEYRSVSRAKFTHRLLYTLQSRFLPRQFRSELLIVFRIKKKVGIQLDDPDRDFDTMTAPFPQIVAVRRSGH